jgi:Gluconate 2-dehydrogenase subunit 3
LNRRNALQKVALMMGGVISAPTMVALLDSCKSTAESAGANFSLSTDYKALVAEIADVIIPKTSTPGAKEAGVGPFIETMLKDCYNEIQQKHFVKGLDSVVEEAEKVGGAFATLKPEQRIAVLKTMETKAKEEQATADKAKQIDPETGLEKKDAKAPETPTPFFNIMKELTLFGYFTSEIGCKEALAYDPVPGPYKGCTKLEPGQKAWALS